MLKIFSILLLILCSLTTYADKIAYSVDEFLIFNSHIDNRMKLIQALGVNGVSKKQVIDELINEAIISNIIAKSGMQVTPEKEVESRIEAIADQNEMTIDYFAEELAKKGSSLSALKGYITNQILQSAILGGISNNVEKIGRHELEDIIKLNQNDLNVKVKFFSISSADRKNFNTLFKLRKEVVKSGCQSYNSGENNDIKITEQDQNILKFPGVLPNIIRDLKDGEVSTIFEYQQSLNFIALCRSNIMDLTNNNKSDGIAINLTNFNKISKAQEFLTTWKKNSIIKKY